MNISVSSFTYLFFLVIEFKVFPEAGILESSGGIWAAGIPKCRD